jgi:hypothetical protein
MIFLLQGANREGEPPRRDPNALMALFVTVFTLIVAMITYSVIAGEGGISGQEAASELMAGLNLVFAIFMLFYSLQFLLENSSEYATVAKAARWTVVAIVPIIEFMFLVHGSYDTEYVRSLPADPGMPRRCDGSITVAAVDWALVIVMALCLIVANTFRWHARWAERHRTLTPIVFMITSVITLVLFGILDGGPATFVAPRWALILFTSIAAALLGGGAVIVRIGSPEAVVTPSSAHDPARATDGSSSTGSPRNARNQETTIRVRGVIRVKKHFR